MYDDRETCVRSPIERPGSHASLLRGPRCDSATRLPLATGPECGSRWTKGEQDKIALGGSRDSEKRCDNGERRLAWDLCSTTRASGAHAMDALGAIKTPSTWMLAGRVLFAGEATHRVRHATADRALSTAPEEGPAPGAAPR